MYTPLTSPPFRYCLSASNWFLGRHLMCMRNVCVCVCSLKSLRFTLNGTSNNNNKKRQSRPYELLICIANRVSLVCDEENVIIISNLAKKRTNKQQHFRLILMGGALRWEALFIYSRLPAHCNGQFYCGVVFAVFLSSRLDECAWFRTNWFELCWLAIVCTFTVFSSTCLHKYNLKSSLLIHIKKPYIRPWCGIRNKNKCNAHRFFHQCDQTGPKWFRINRISDKEP